jgi:hypothetical protein
VPGLTSFQDSGREGGPAEWAAVGAERLAALTEGIMAAAKPTAAAHTAATRTK